MSNNTESMLSENYLVYASWAVSLIFGIPVNAYCLYHLIKVTKLNVYIKAIFVILVINSISGYVAIFCSLIPIIFFKIQNHLTCTILTTPMGYPFLQPMSAVTSMTRFYMAWMTSKNKVYRNNIIVFTITATVVLFYSLPIITEIFYDKYMVLACMNRQDLINYQNPVTVIVTAIMAVSTLCGITADICMMKFLKKLKPVSHGVQLIPWIVPNDKSKNLEEAVPRNSTLFSTTILCISGFWFAFCDTLAETLLLTTIVNIFIMPFIIKFTVSSNLRTKIEVPNGLQFHNNQDLMLDSQIDGPEIVSLHLFATFNNEGKTYSIYRMRTIISPAVYDQARLILQTIYVLNKEILQ